MTIPNEIKSLQGQKLDQSCIGRSFIRIAPTHDGDYSYSAAFYEDQYSMCTTEDKIYQLRSQSVLLNDITDGQLEVSTQFYTKPIGLEFNDNKWIPLDSALRALKLID